jgi:hypothetical protein
MSESGGEDRREEHEPQIPVQRNENRHAGNGQAHAGHALRDAGDEDRRDRDYEPDIDGNGAVNHRMYPIWQM